MEITGIVLTKLDGSSKGGVVLGICDELKVPVRYVGIGEKIDDLRPFDPGVSSLCRVSLETERGAGREPQLAIWPKRVSEVLID